MSATKERPIIFNAQEVNAVLAGNKTQHRVIIENTKDTQCLFSRDWRYDGRDFLDSDGFTSDPKGAHYVERLEPEQGEENQYTEDYRCIGHCPLGDIGDRLLMEEPRLSDFNSEHIAPCPRSVLVEIADIRIERVQDITLGDSFKEGCDGLMDFTANYWMPKHGEAAWFTDPWVWVIEFKVIGDADGTN